ncbi:unnamed protein product [Rotaria magnacalcarata]|uniref:Uncharacterized protein n=1 Tax=Rotaria magnacalcarata TaxID=392030 RepID=A0A816Z9E7_9BILA|nr:unnamed protein product [Rotaria magnacalcarata]
MEYISSPDDLYYAFSGLTQRLDMILRSIRLSIDIFRENIHNLMLAHYFSTHCNRLRMYNICPSITLVRFRRLCSLTMIEPTESQFNSIQSRSLPILEYLTSPATIVSIFTIDNMKELFKYNFILIWITFDCLFGKKQQRWHILRSCITCSRATLSRLLVLLPHLKYLRVNMIHNDRSNWILPANVKELVSLRIGLFQLIYDDIYCLIGPELHLLHLDIYNKNTPIDFSTLSTLLMSKPQKLKRFNCDYRGSTVNLNKIRVRYPIFQNIEVENTYPNSIIKLVYKYMQQFESIILEL